MKRHILIASLLIYTPVFADIQVEHLHWQTKATTVYSSLPEKAKEIDVVLKKKGPTQYSYPNEIWMSDWNKNSFIHEMGHHLHVQILQTHYTATFAEWGVFWETNRSKFPTDYSKSNVYEGFAVAFGRWQRNLNLHKDIRDWMQTRIGE